MKTACLCSLLASVLLLGACRDGGQTAGVVATPTFDTVQPGSYSSAQSVTLACATEGATIYYTTDGLNPQAFGWTYTGAIAVPVGTNMTIKAFASADGWTDSGLLTGDFSVARAVVATPTFDTVLPGSYLSEQSVTLACSTEGATIRYTTDGGSPEAFGSTYTGAITVPVGTSMTISAYAYAEGLIDSGLLSGSFKVVRSYYYAVNSNGNSVSG